MVGPVMSDSSYDLVIVGAGPGGYVAAIRAAQLGLRVACVEKERTLGGTCLNVGCIPSKALLDSSEHYHDLTARLAPHGIRVHGVELDVAAMIARKDKIVSILTRGIAGLFRKHKIEHIQGVARFETPGRVQVDGPERRVLTAPRILIATGSVPVDLPALPFDGARIISSTDALRLREVPRRLLVVGGGAIGLELGSVWRRLGAEVLVVEFLDRILSGADTQLAAALQRSLEKQGMQFRLRTTATRMETTGAEVRVTLTTDGVEQTETYDVVLVAVGRRPNTEGLGIQEMGVATDERGRIIVDDRYATNVSGIFAIGDVIPGLMLAHRAQEEGLAVAELLAGQAGHVNYAAIPSVVYTSPELASVGLSEADAAARGHAVRVGSFPFMANGRARCLDETDGSVKVVADAATDRLLGVHILGPRASELIAEATLAIEFSASVEDLALAVHAHPTLAEALKEAALAARGRSLHS